MQSLEEIIYEVMNEEDPEAERQIWRFAARVMLGLEQLGDHEADNKTDS